MKTIYLLALLLGVALTATAQDVPKAQYESLYRFRFVADTVENIVQEDLMVLRFNGKQSLFFSEQSRRVDSIIATDFANASFNELLAERKKLGHKVVDLTLSKDFTTKQIDHSENFSNNYRYQEELPTFDWQISDETKKIWDYTCQKAVCTFRGRTYVAWFTSEVPIKEGPWKFHGLPGLILEVGDTEGYYSFSFLGLRQSDAPMNFLKKKYIQMTREQFLKSLKNYLKDPFAFQMSTSGIKIKADEETMRKLRRNKKKNDPMERE